jgi:hypothetical protein
VKPHEAKKSTAKSTSQEAEDCIAKPQEAKQTTIITQKKREERWERCETWHFGRTSGKLKLAT